MPIAEQTQLPLHEDPTATPPGSRGLSRRPGTGSLLHLAAFASPLTERVGRGLGFPVAVIDVVADPSAHAARLGGELHAGWIPGHGTDAFDLDDPAPAACVYAPVPFHRDCLGGGRTPGALEWRDGHVALHLPDGVPPGAVAHAFAQAMTGHRFDEVAHAPAMALRRHRAGMSVGASPRYSAVPAAGLRGRVSIVRDLYAFRPADQRAAVRAAADALRVLGVWAVLSDATAARGARPPEAPGRGRGASAGPSPGR